MMQDKDFKAAKDPSLVAIGFEMTPERKEKFKRVSGDIIDLLKKRTDSPLESYMILRFVIDGFEKCYDIKGGMALSTVETKE